MNEGFVTIYYLPSDLCFMKNKELSKVIKTINLNLKKHLEMAISSNIKDYDILVEKFPFKS